METRTIVPISGYYNHQYNTEHAVVADLSICRTRRPSQTAKASCCNQPWKYGLVAGQRGIHHHG
eukprot:1851529-Pleurochrysis_carterae.AAC.1